MSRKWLYVPEISAGGVLRALRAGPIFGVHGRIARRVELTVATDGLARPGMAGEVIQVPAGASITATLRMQVPDQDWEGQPNRIDQVELIAVTKDKIAVIATRTTKGSGEALRETIAVPSGGVVLRARGRRISPGGAALLFYTNPIHIVTGGTS